jgi:hypothetical protein
MYCYYYYSETVMKLVTIISRFILHPLGDVHRKESQTSTLEVRKLQQVEGLWER